MLKENSYMTFISSFEPTSLPSCKDLWLIFKDNLLLVERKDSILSIPIAESTAVIHSKLIKAHHLGTFQGYSCYAGEL